MKLPIRKEYFDQIKKGIKKFEVRDAHLTLQCIETGEEHRVDIDKVILCNKRSPLLLNISPWLPMALKDETMFEPDQDKVIVFKIR